MEYQIVLENPCSFKESIVSLVIEVINNYLIDNYLKFILLQKSKSFSVSKTKDLHFQTNVSYRFMNVSFAGN